MHLDGYHIYKHEYYNNFLAIVSKLENLEKHLYFYFNMIVYQEKKLILILITNSFYM